MLWNIVVMKESLLKSMNWCKFLLKICYNIIYNKCILELRSDIVFYKKFETDAEDCISIKTISVVEKSNLVLFFQLITDGSIIDENIEETTIDDAKKYFQSLKSEYCDGLSNKELDQHFNNSASAFIKELRIKQPSYCMLSIYSYDDNRWILCGRKIIANKKNKIFNDFNLIKNIPYIGGEFIADVKPEQELPDQKILKRKK